MIPHHPQKSIEPALQSKTFYKRPLPPSCISFTSARGKELFAQALQEGNMESYFPLASHMLTQNEPAYCALGTLATILNALEVDPQRVWKGPWRYYEQSMLDCCRPLDDVAQVGLTLAEFACLARCNGLSATVWSPSVTETAEQREEGLQNFRAAVKRTATSSGLNSSLMALAYSRKSLGQTGDGHFSPVGGYNEKDDMVLILDVARFKYPSYWISVTDAYDSMIPLDKATGQPRGFAVLSILPPEDPSSLAAPLSQTTLTLNKSSWSSLSNSLTHLLLATPRSAASAPDLLSPLISHLASLPTAPVAPRSSPLTALAPLLASLAGTPLSTLCPPSHPLLPLLLLALFSPKSALATLVPPQARDALAQAVSETLEKGGDALASEVQVLVTQMGALGACCRAEEEGDCGCSGPASKALPTSEAK